MHDALESYRAEQMKKYSSINLDLAINRFLPGEKVVFKDAFVCAAGIQRCYWKVATFYHYVGDDRSQAKIGVVGDIKTRLVSSYLLFDKSSEHGWCYNMWQDDNRKKNKKYKRWTWFFLIAAIIGLLVNGYLKNWFGV